MSRKSLRLEKSGYYVPDDDAASMSSAGRISYKESTVRVFNKRRMTGRLSHTSSCASNAEEHAGMGTNTLFRTPRVTTSSNEPHGFSSGYSSSSSSEVSNRRPSLAPSINTTILVLILVLAFGVCCWYPYAPDHSNESLFKNHVPRFNMAALKDEMYAGMHKRQDEWSENHGREREDMMREITLLKQEYEMMQTDINHLRQAKNVESEHCRQNMVRVESETTNLRSQLESLNAKLKAELSSELDVSRLGVVLHPDLQRALEGLEKHLMDRLEQESEKGETLQQKGTGAVTMQDVEQIVQGALRLHRADEIGMADYALEASGASVINTRCSETYQTWSTVFTVFGFPVWYFSNWGPSTIIQPEVHLGKCWAYRGAQGFVVVALSRPLHITHVTLQHLPRELSPTGHIHSAPRDFAVYGMSNENEEGTLLGTFAYDQDGEPIQTFTLPDSESVYRMVELQILSNWGHPEYTCVYRFRVHGDAQSA